MKIRDHSFDWRGFTFSLKLVAVCFVVGLGIHGGWSYLTSSPSPKAIADIQAAPMISTAPIVALSTTTSERVINGATIEDMVPPTGKFIAADLVNMKLYLYQDGTTTAEYPILTKGKPGTPYETPAGVYSVLTKEQDHFNRGEQVHMPYSMEFYGNYFIHGWPTHDDGTPVASTYSGGCIRLSTEDAAKVYAFADRGTRVFVYDTGSAASEPPLALTDTSLPSLSAASYLVADIDTGDVYAEKNAQVQRPIASVTKLMTALVANETIMFDHPITVPRGELEDTPDATDTKQETFVVGDLLYPLLMESNNGIADALAHYYGTSGFVDWMNSQAKALDMASTTFADPSGASPDNVSTPEDLYRLAVYLANKKSFVWNITRAPQKTITADDGSSYTFTNFNLFSGLDSFVGGKVGHTTPAQDTMVSVFSMHINGQERRIAVVVLDSQNYATDTKNLANWFAASSAHATSASGAACASCAQHPVYRKISL